jgi:hypothetical protein
MSASAGWTGYPKGDNAKDLEGGYGGSASSSVTYQLALVSQSIRMGFVRKVYSILAVQLFVTFGIVSLFVTNESIKEAVQQNRGYYYSALGLNFAFLIALACCTNVARNYPTNYVCLAGFTLTEAYLVGTVSSYYDTDIVFLAVAITGAVFLGLTAFAWQTKVDFTAMSGGLFALLLVLIICGFMAIFVPGLRVVYAGLGAFVFALFIIYDTQLIIGGKHKKHQFSVDDYVFAALNLYIDVINLFLYILALLGGSKRK